MDQRASTANEPIIGTRRRLSIDSDDGDKADELSASQPPVDHCLDGAYSQCSPHGCPSSVWCVRVELENGALDFAGLDALQELVRILERRSISTKIACAHGPLRDLFARSD